MRRRYLELRSEPWNLRERFEGSRDWLGLLWVTGMVVYVKMYD